MGELTCPRCCCSMDSTQEPPNSSTPGPFDGPQWPHQAPRAMYLGVAVLMGLVVASASVLNGLVIVVSIRHKRLRSPLNYILVNLAVANLLVTLCGSSVSLSNNIRGFFVFGERLCQLEGFMVSLTGKESIQTCPWAVDGAFGFGRGALEMFHHLKSMFLWCGTQLSCCVLQLLVSTGKGWLCQVTTCRVGNATWGHWESLFGMYFMGAGCAPGAGNCTKPLLEDTLLL